MDMWLMNLLPKISWSDYLLTTITIVAIYETGVLLYFYRKIKPQLVSRQKKENDAVMHQDNTPASGSLNNVQPKTAVDKAELPTPVELFVEELKVFAEQAGEDNLERDEIIAGLKQLLQRDSAVKAMVYRENLTKLIDLTIEHHCAVKLSDEELSELW